MDFHALSNPRGTYPFPPGPNGNNGGLLGSRPGGSRGGPGIRSSSPSGFGNIHSNGYLGKDWGHKQKDASEAEKDESKQEERIVLGRSTYDQVGKNAVGLVEKKFALDAPSLLQNSTTPPVTQQPCSTKCFWLRSTLQQLCLKLM